ncbi:hypothetical protein LIER_15673 [Lithospermum erythrorhizon]|uniref:Uncharacterized protein n=1 Tax=Lithospermum erythrorhizon TaxID=34254 RepID=A0AAV3Q5Q4_LITER
MESINIKVLDQELETAEEDVDVGTTTTNKLLTVEVGSQMVVKEMIVVATTSVPYDQPTESKRIIRFITLFLNLIKESQLEGKNLLITKNDRTHCFESLRSSLGLCVIDK